LYLYRRCWLWRWWWRRWRWWRAVFYIEIEIKIEIEIVFCYGITVNIYNEIKSKLECSLRCCWCWWHSRWLNGKKKLKIKNSTFKSTKNKNYFKKQLSYRRRWRCARKGRRWRQCYQRLKANAAQTRLFSVNIQQIN